MARPRLARFGLIVLSVTLLGELPFVLLTLSLVPRHRSAAALAAAALCALLTVPLVIRIRRGFGEEAERGLVGPLLVVFYLFWATSACAGLAWLPLRAAAWAFGWPTEGASLAALGLGLLQGTLGVSLRRMRPRFEHVEVPIPGLPVRLDGYRIAQLSDLHVGRHTPPERVRLWVERINRLDVDLVAVTGDLITSGDTYVQAMARELGRLRGRDGVALCLGNHDYFTDAEVLVAALEREGIDVLRNRGRVVGSGDRSYYLAGVDDTWTRRADVARALAERPADLHAIVLAHDPKLFDEAARHGASLVLSGHTHGGQIAVPFLGHVLNIARIAYRHTRGLYRVGNAHIYVSKGAGTTGPPLRIAAPAEIAVLTLRSAPSA